MIDDIRRLLDITDHPGAGAVRRHLILALSASAEGLDHAIKSADEGELPDDIGFDLDPSKEPFGRDD
ncbi:MAG: hypothetical protein AAFY73_15205 [Pseudomonadota bacterium]